MKNYYEALQVNSDAAPQEIKKAYFRMVRKYPPDRFEREFMEIREAYEALSNEKTRKEYDALSELSDLVRTSYDRARGEMDEGNFNAAIRILEKLLLKDPESLLISSLLGEAYLGNGNNGKALKIFETLTAKESSNASFAGNLAYAYLGRGWHKKAVRAFEGAIALDKDNVSLWLGLSEAFLINNEPYKAQRILESSIARAKENNSESIVIYMRIITIDIMLGDAEKLENHLDQLIRLAKEEENEKDNVGWVLASLARAMVQSGLPEQAENVIQKVVKLLPEDENIRKLKQEIEGFGRLQEVLSKLHEDSKIHEDIGALIAIEILPSELTGVSELEKKAAVFFGERTIAENYSTYRSSIDRLKKNYGELYEVKKEFFDSIKDESKRKSVIKAYKKEAANYAWLQNLFMQQETAYDDDEYDDDDEYYDFEPQEPFLREEPKVGRNDPCPCGSGKKYKKCCGK